MKKNLLLILMLITFQVSYGINTEQGEFDKISKAVGNYLINNKQKKFIKDFKPTKEDILEFAYHKSPSEVPAIERLGFYNTIKPTINRLDEDLPSSFQFIQTKLKENGINEINSIELNSVEDDTYGKTPVKNIYFTINGNGNSFKIEITGAYKTSRGWIIMGDLAPSYF